MMLSGGKGMEGVMSNDVIESLMKAEGSYPRAFSVAQPFWDAFYAEHDGADDAALQKAIEDAQKPFNGCWRRTLVFCPHSLRTLWRLRRSVHCSGTGLKIGTSLNA